MIKLFKSIFCVISKDEAVSMGLHHTQNIYGDMISKLNCRSIWKDLKGRRYRVKELKNGMSWNELDRDGEIK